MTPGTIMVKTWQGENVQVSNLSLKVDKDQKNTIFYKIVGTHCDFVQKNTMLDYSYDRNKIENTYNKLLTRLLDAQEKKLVC